MRERVARWIAALAVGTLVVLAMAFARQQNPEVVSGSQAASAAAGAPASTGEPAAAPAAGLAAPSPAAADSARGHAVFLAQGCTRCHSVAGAGSPRLPLDGVGARRTAAELRAWTTGAEALADSIAPGTLRVKQGYAKLPAAELDALIVFLARLKTPR
jgi:hypothetical protein